MASHTKSTPSRAAVLARSLVLGLCCIQAVPSWAARDAAQMIAQDKANKDVIARRQAAIDARYRQRAPQATATAASATALPVTAQ